MATDVPSFRDLVFSDYARYRPGSRQSWLHVLLRIPSVPGLLASLVLRSQQCLYRSGRVTAAHSLRTLGNVLVGADFGAGMQVGRGFMLAHPVGVTIGFGLVIGDDVTLVGGVTIGRGAMVGANSVVLSDVPENAVVMGSPARRVGTRGEGA
jgi:serine O-acetyltransferase